jgi:hypothetical protein
MSIGDICSSNAPVGSWWGGKMPCLLETSLNATQCAVAHGRQNVLFLSKLPFVFGLIEVL